MRPPSTGLCQTMDRKDAENGSASEVSELRKEVERLRIELAKERQRRIQAEEVVIKVKRDSAATQVIVEQEEEYISNMLMKRLAELKSEKEQLALKIEEEEEYLTNNLQLKLNEAKREKIELENQLEQEQEYITNKLQRQLDELRAEKKQLERKVEQLSLTNSPATSIRSLDALPRDSSLSREGSISLKLPDSRNPSNSSSFSHHSSSVP